MRAEEALIVTILLLVIAAPLGVAVAYLVSLTFAAVLSRRRQLPIARTYARFAVLIPAHNEECVIAEGLRSLACLHYPRDRYDVYVVADNCTDRTADVARAAAPSLNLDVLERRDEKQRGKGYAIEWLLAHISPERHYDAYVMLDADWTVASNLLDLANTYLQSGVSLIQVWCRVADPESSWVAGLRSVAFALVNYLRPLGANALGLSCGLKGTGMVLADAVLREHGWSSVSLIEDVEQHIKLLFAGQRVVFAPETWIASPMPGTLRAARSQNLRWESGKLALLRDYLVPLLRRGFAGRDLLLINEAIGLLVPPLSLLGALCIGFLAVSVLLGVRSASVIGLLLLAGLAFHVGVGLLLLRPPRRVLLALLFAPLFIAWKVGVYSAAAVQRGRGPWVRTARSGEVAR